MGTDRVSPSRAPSAVALVALLASGAAAQAPAGNADTVKAAVASLQGRLQFGAIFVSDRYGEIAGTLPMDLIKTETLRQLKEREPWLTFTWEDLQEVCETEQRGFL